VASFWFGTVTQSKSQSIISRGGREDHVQWSLVWTWLWVQYAYDLRRDEWRAFLRCQRERRTIGTRVGDEPA
jgi:hypothetical protein